MRNIWTETFESFVKSTLKFTLINCANWPTIWVFAPCRILLASLTKDTRRPNIYFFAAQIQITITIANVIYLWFGTKGLVFCKNNGWIMKDMYKGLTAQKWVQIVWRKIPQIPQNWSAQVQMFWVSMKKGFIGHP